MKEEDQNYERFLACISKWDRYRCGGVWLPEDGTSQGKAIPNQQLNIITYIKQYPDGHYEMHNHRMGSKGMELLAACNISNLKQLYVSVNDFGM